jgi:hypothetical protein
MIKLIFGILRCTQKISVGGIMIISVGIQKKAMVFYSALYKKKKDFHDFGWLYANSDLTYSVSLFTCATEFQITRDCKSALYDTDTQYI